jgi:hypothetical protein
MNAWNRDLSRRDAMKVLAGAAVTSAMCSGGSAAEEKPPLQVSMSRFMMKGDFPRLEVRTRYYRLIWQARFFGMRLVSTAVHPYDERVSYTNFGPFAVGGLDLFCGHPPHLALALPGGEEVQSGPGTLSACEEQGVFLLEHVDAQQRALRVWIACAADSPHVKVVFLPEGFDAKSPLLLSLPGNLIFDRTTQAASAASFYSTGAGTGLRVSGQERNCVSLVDSPQSKTLVCRLPIGRRSEWLWTVLGPDEAPRPEEPSAPRLGKLGLVGIKCRSVPVAKLERWERH